MGNSKRSTHCVGSDRYPRPDVEGKGSIRHPSPIAVLAARGIVARKRIRASGDFPEQNGIADADEGKD